MVGKEFYTKEGYLAEIIDYNEDQEYPILARVYWPNGTSDDISYTKDGRFMTGELSPEDLVLCN